MCDVCFLIQMGRLKVSSYILARILKIHQQFFHHGFCIWLNAKNYGLGNLFAVLWHCSLGLSFLACSVMLYSLACFAFCPLLALGCLLFLFTGLVVGFVLLAAGCFWLLVALVLLGFLAAGCVCLAWFASECLLPAFAGSLLAVH